MSITMTNTGYTLFQNNYVNRWNEIKKGTLNLEKL